MWLLIKLRLRRLVRIYVWIYCFAWVASAGAAFAEPALRSPERIAVLAGVGALVLGFIAQAATYSIEAREKRIALHMTLPLSKGELIGQHIVEPLLAPIAVGLASLGLALGLRAFFGGPSDVTILLFLAAVAALMLIWSQLQVFIDEVQRQVRFRKLAGMVLMITLAAGGALVGFALASFATAGEGEVPTAVAFIGQGSVVGSFLVLAGLVAGLNGQLLARRQSYLS